MLKNMQKIRKNGKSRFTLRKVVECEGPDATPARVGLKAECDKDSDDDHGAPNMEM